MRIAVVGPDGAGKSSVCEALSLRIESAKIVYAGKREFHYKATDWALGLWAKIAKRSAILSVFAQYMIYYPIEFVENYNRFTKKYNNAKVIIYDRHPIDRMIMKYEFYAKFKIGKITLAHLIFEYPFRAFWGFVYYRFFPSIDMIFLLAPQADILFERSSDEYNDIAEAETRLNAYKLVLGRGKFVDLAEILNIKKDDIIDEICKQIKSAIVDIDNTII